MTKPPHLQQGSVQHHCNYNGSFAACAQKSFKFFLTGSNNYRAWRGHHCSHLVDKLGEDLQNAGLGTLRSDYQLRKLKALSKERAEWFPMKKNWMLLEDVWWIFGWVLCHIKHCRLFNTKSSLYIYIIWFVWVGFYGISTIVDYLIPNPLYTYISNI